VPLSLNGESVSSEAQLRGLSVHWTGQYDLPGKKPMIIDGDIPVVVDAARRSIPAEKPIVADGKLDEWPAQLSEPQGFAQVIGPRPAYGGPNDSSFSMASRYDAENLYLALKVSDDSIVTSSSEKDQIGDSIVLRIDPESESEEYTSVSLAPRSPKVRRARSRNPEARDPDGIIRLQAAPFAADSGSSKTIRFLGGPGKGITGACLAAKGGYAAEIAVPLALLKDTQGGEDWDSFRVNVTIHDHDGRHKASPSVLWWRPDWVGPENYANSGLFVREDKERP
jgi:hypothetical protein